MPGAVKAVLDRHRLITIILLATLTLLAWAWLLAGAGMEMEQQGDMADHDRMANQAMPNMAVPAIAAALLVFVMWFVMMIAMMLPAAAPTILLFGRASVHNVTATPPTGSFLMGYLAVWCLFSLGATALQLLALQLGAIGPVAMALENDGLAAGLFIAAGAYQLSPIKDMCLRHCRSPAQWLSEHYRPGRAGAFAMGAVHGGYCVGCCWLLMLLLFIGGVMNLAWIALLTLMVAAEKMLPVGRAVAVFGGSAFIGWGGYLLLR